MNILPSFILKKVYQKGSLKQTAEGITFKLKNILGPGVITGVNSVKINDEIYNNNVIKIIKSGAAILAEEVTSDDPMLFKLNEDITCVINTCLGLQEGLNKIIVELISEDVGKVSVTLSDTL